MEDKKILTIQDKLNLPIRKQEIESRQGLSYITGFTVIDTLNKIFGYDGWQWEVIEIDKILDIKDDKDKFNVLFRVHGRLTVKTPDGPLIKDGCAVGSGNEKNFAAAYHNALGEAETDALKRAARLLGYKTGLALYDKKQRYVK